jgi:hypothetical protein
MLQNSNEWKRKISQHIRYHGPHVFIEGRKKNIFTGQLMEQRFFNLDVSFKM